MNPNEGPKDQLLLAQQYATGELEAECDDEAFQLCKLVGEKGGAKVIYLLGICYHYGWGTYMDLKAAVECYVRAAGLGSFEALRRLYYLRNDQSVQTNLQNAFRDFYDRAGQDDVRAQFNVGYCYFWRIGTSEDKAKARDPFQMAAGQGCADAVWMLERCRAEGFGDGYNGMQGIKLLKCAAELGSVEAQNELGYAYKNGKTGYDLEVEQDYKQAAEWFQKAADQNYTWATYYLAWRYYYGKGVQKDIKKVFQLHKKAALMGHEWSQNNISDFYRHRMPGLSDDEWPVDIDYYEAMYWSWKAVDQNDKDVKNGVTDILKSIGVTQDQINELKNQTSSFESAKTWYDIAKQYEIGDGVEKDEQKAFQMYRLAARLGSISAKTALGRCYKMGSSTNVDTQHAIHWYEKVAIQGDHEAAKSLLSLVQPESMSKTLKTESLFVTLAECYETGRGVLRNEDTALLMREHAAADGDIEQAKVVIEAYISGNDNEYRIRSVGSIVAKTSGLSSKDYQQFIKLFNDSIDELDKMLIRQNTAAAIRAEIMGINIILE